MPIHTWRIFVPGFIQIPPLNTEISRHAKHELTDNDRTAGRHTVKRIASDVDSPMANAKKVMRVDIELIIRKAVVRPCSLYRLLQSSQINIR